MSAALFDLDNDGTLEILISRANIKKITRVTVAEPGRKTAKIFLPDVPPLESEWQREFYDATGVFPYGWYECPVCGYRTDWEPHACPICHTLLEP